MMIGVILGSAESLDPFAGGAGSLMDVPGDGCRPNEGDGGDVGVIDQGVDGHLVAVDDVEDTVGKTRLSPQPGDDVGG